MVSEGVFNIRGMGLYCIVVRCFVSIALYRIRLTYFLVFVCWRSFGFYFWARHGFNLLPWFCSVGDCCVFAGVGVLYVVVCCFLLYMLVFSGCFVGAECCCLWVFLCICLYDLLCMLVGCCLLVFFCCLLVDFMCIFCWSRGFSWEVRKCEWGAGVKCNQISNPQVGISINGVTQNVWFVMEDPIEMDDN